MSEGIDSAAGTKAPVTQAYTTPVYCPVEVEEPALQGFYEGSRSRAPPDSSLMFNTLLLSHGLGKRAAAPAAMPTL